MEIQRLFYDWPLLPITADGTSHGTEELERKAESSAN